MKLDLFKKISLLFTLLLCVINPSKAALITTQFSDLIDNEGTVDINLTLNSGETFSGFSLYFSETVFSNLAIISSPAEWDSIVIQPDLLLGAGLFDSYNPAGLASGFARVSFTYLATTPFQSLAYDFFDADFQVLASGTSTNVTTSVPESSSFILLLLGLIALGLRQFARRSRAIFHSTHVQQVAV